MTEKRFRPHSPNLSLLNFLPISLTTCVITANFLPLQHISIIKHEQQRLIYKTLLRQTSDYRQFAAYHSLRVCADMAGSVIP